MIEKLAIDWLWFAAFLYPFSFIVVWFGEARESCTSTAVCVCGRRRLAGSFCDDEGRSRACDLLTKNCPCCQDILNGAESTGRRDDDV